MQYQIKFWDMNFARFAYAYIVAYSTSEARLKFLRQMAAKKVLVSFHSARAIRAAA